MNKLITILASLTLMLSFNVSAKTQPIFEVNSVVPMNYSPSLCGHKLIKPTKNTYKISNVKKHCSCFPKEAMCIARVKVIYK